MNKVWVYGSLLFFLFVMTFCIQPLESAIRNGQIQQTDSIEEHDSFYQVDENDISYNKLLSIERQIALNTQMLNLYQQRLNILLQLRSAIKRQITENRIRGGQQQSQEKSQRISGSISETVQKTKIIDKNQNPIAASNRKSKTVYQEESSFHVLLNKYQISQQIKQNKEQLPIQSGTFYNRNSIIMIPPFIINKDKSSVTLINNLNRQRDQVSAIQNAIYDFGTTSNRILFYSLEKDHQMTRKHEYYKNKDKQQSYILNLALQIKPNKIKCVKITYHPMNHSQSFQIEEQVTSYQSNPLISQNFKWHKALDFDNLIIGFDNQTIFIKGKDKKMEQIQIGSRIIGLYSLNQFKVLVITEKKLGTINVRSLAFTQDIRFQHYLGNRTLIKEKQILKQKSQSSVDENVEEDYVSESHDEGSFWHSPFSKKFSQIRAVSIYDLDVARQFLILLSNGDLIFYYNDKIVHSTNLGKQFMKQLSFASLRHKDQSVQNALKSVKIKLDVMPGYNYLLMSSTWHSKLLVFNLTIPHLSESRGRQGFSFFSSSSGGNEMSCKYWLSIDFPQQHQSQGHQADHQQKKLKEKEIQLYIESGPIKFKSNEIIEDASQSQLKSLFVYYCYLYEVNSQKDPRISQSFVIQQYRLLLNLFDSHTSIGGDLSSGSTQGRSYLWNIFMIGLVILGVVIFRKCKKSTDQIDPFQLEEMQKYGFPTSKPSSTLTNNPLQSKKRSNLTKTLSGQKQIVQSSQQYGDKVISQLQSYLSKQGQRLSRQQLTQMVKQFQQNEDQQEQIIRPKMERQQTTQSFRANPKEKDITNIRQALNISENRKKETGNYKRKKQ